MKDYRQMELFPTEEELTLSVEATRVSRFPLPDIKKAKRIKDTSGRNILGSLENCVRITRLERTWADIFDSVWIPYSKTWTAKTTPLGALVLKQRVSVPPTAGNGSSGSQQTWPTPNTSDRFHANMKDNHDIKKGYLRGAVQEKLWATPSAMDHLPQRSAEATLRLQEGQRKGRTRPSNLREQVDPETMKMYPTPAAEEPGWKYIEVVDKDGNPPTHPNQRFYDKKTGRLVQKGLEQVIKMYPTPTLSDTEGGIVKNVELNNGSFSRRNKQGVRWGVKLRDAVNHLEQQQMWPTPTTQEIEHPQAELTATGRRKTKDGTNSHSLNLADTVQAMMWPTPNSSPNTVSQTVEATLNLRKRNRKQGQLMEAIVEQMLPTPTERDRKGGHGTLVKKNGKYYRVSNTTGTRFGARLDAVVEKEQEVAQEMWPTIVAHEGRLGYQRRDTGKKGTQKSLTTIVVDKEGGRKATKLHLNPTWVEALMGFPPGWTVLGNEESQE